MAHSYEPASREDRPPFEYSYNSSDEEPFNDEIKAVKKVNTRRKNSFKKNVAGSKPLISKTQLEASNKDEIVNATAQSTAVFIENQESKPHKRSVSYERPLRALHVDHSTAMFAQSTTDGHEMRTGRKQDNRCLTVCGTAVTYRGMSNLCICWSYVMFFLAGLLLGGFLLDFSETNVKRPSDDFFSSPWTWPEGNLTVGAYYYPWHSNGFHNGAGYLRKQLSTKQEPTLGEYDDTDPNVIYQHLKWSAQANVRLWVTSWWGAGSREDNTTKNVIFQHEALGDHKVALFYETTGRIREKDEYSTHNVIPDITYICQSYFDHPNYFRIDGRPVLFVYLTRKLETLGLLDDVVSDMRQSAQSEGYDIYIVGDQVFQAAPENELVVPPFALLDAITNYDVYGSMEQPTPYATEDGIHKHFQRSKEWKEVAKEQKCAFIPCVSPGYNDLAIRPEENHGPLSRQLSANASEGSLFQTALQYGRRLVEAGTGNVIMVNSFNEWHEDTQIEPVQGGSTSLPETLTQGIEYVGYGELYLNILREETTYA